MFCYRLFTRLFSCIMVICGYLSADVHPPGDERPYDEQFPPQPAFELPWLTGPLLAPSGHVVPLGHINIEPYFFANVNRGKYNRHWASHKEPNFYNMNTEVPLQFGIMPRWEYTITPAFSWNHTHGASDWVLNDIPFTFGFQALYDKPQEGMWFPGIKLVLKGNFPVGRYQKLDPDKKGTDAGGSGNWGPGAGLTFSRLFHYTGVHFLSTRLVLQYTVPNAVHVKGLNAYGGGHHTRGKVFPGPVFYADMGLEYTLTQKWALALDIVYLHQNHTRFTGRKGSTGGVPNSIGSPSSEQFSLAPAFEYNWNANCGLIAGIWFSVAGRNTAEYVNGVVAINIYK